MPGKKHRRLALRGSVLRGALCWLCLLAACGHNQTAPVSDAESATARKSSDGDVAPPLGEQTEQKLDPLTREDVELYLKVMRAAVQRIQAPTADDRAALAAAQALLARRPAKPTPEDAKTLERATLIATAMDQVVAQEMNIDGRTYRGIAEAVEVVVLNPTPTLAVTTSAGTEPPVLKTAPTPLETRLESVDAANAATLEPYRSEIQSLIAVVRNPANVPR